MRAHEAGALHAEAGHRGPSWLQAPDDVNALYPGLWPDGVTRDDDGVLRVAGMDVRALAAQFGTPAYVVDEADFRARARAFRDAFAGVAAGAQVYYAGKAFLCTEVARWIADE